MVIGMCIYAWKCDVSEAWKDDRRIQNTRHDVKFAIKYGLTLCWIGSVIVVNLYH